MLCAYPLLPLLLLAACSAPSDAQSNYPQNPTISDAQGRLRDSTTFYFPIDSVRRPAKDFRAPAANGQLEYCQFALAHCSCNLLYFGAPVLSNYYLGQETYRFLWLRSFHRPVLLTLTQQENGGLLRTQYLTKPACGPKLTPILFIPPQASAAEAHRLQQEFQKRQADPAVQRKMAEANRPPVQVVKAETTRPVSPQQWQQFKQLLTKSEFQQLSDCQESGILDGAYWLLEAHQASGYHMVFRHSPTGASTFRQACEYLLDLSSARNEERY